MTTLRVSPLTAHSTFQEWTLNEDHKPEREHIRSGRMTIPMRRTSIGGVTYKVADSREEREGAMRLVYEAYYKTGLIPDNSFGMRVTPYHLAPTTDVFTATHEGHVIYTVTLISDGDEGMPLEAIFEDEVQEMRSAGMRLAEISCLAGRDGCFDQKQRIQVFTNLIGLMFQYGRYNGIDRLLMAVHPRHARYYHRFLGCEPISGVKEYDAVLGNPAVMCVHDYARNDEHHYRLYDDIYRMPYARWELCRQPMLAADRVYFSRMVTQQHGEMVSVGA